MFPFFSVPLKKISDSIEFSLSAFSCEDLFFCNFNCHHVNWFHDFHSTADAGILAFNFSVAQSLCQTVHFPIRFRNTSNNTLYMISSLTAHLNILGYCSSVLLAIRITL